MEKENSDEMDVSYGVEKEKEPYKFKRTKSKTETITSDTPEASEVEDSVDATAKDTEGNLIDQINSMKANGDIKNPEFKKKMRELEEVLGVDQINPFGTNEIDIFEDKLKEMNSADMQNLAYKVGINPYQGKSLKNNLMREFMGYNRNNMRNSMPSATQAIKLDPNNPQHAETIKILGEI